MKRKTNILIRRGKISRELMRRGLIQSAKEASADAKRSSKALNIPFDIIKNDGIYQVFDNSMIKTCLLYTSPSPRDATLSRMPSSA